MAGLDGWTALPLAAALAAGGVVAWRVRVLFFRAALDGPAFAAELRARLQGGQTEAARALVQALRPAWAAEIASRALAARAAGEDLGFALEEARAEFVFAAQRGFVALRALARLALPLALAIAIVELGLGFDPAPELERAAAASGAMSRALFAVSTGMAVSIACQVSYGLLARAAKRRLVEVDKTSDVFLTRGSART